MQRFGLRREHWQGSQRCEIWSSWWPWKFVFLVVKVVGSPLAMGVG